MHPSVRALWRAYLDTLGETPETTGRTFEHWHFCDNERDANDLAALVLSGTKRATTPSLWAVEEGIEAMPEAGDLHIITDWAGRAQCIIRVTEVQVVPFNEVDAAYARTEGEGDRSLAYWRRVHWAYYHRELSGTNRTPTKDMPVVCTTFEVVYTAQSADNKSTLI